MKPLLALLLLAVLTACGGASTDADSAPDRASDVALVTELMHRDAALLNLLDVALGRRLDPQVVAATEQLRLDATARIETAAARLEGWGEQVPKTVRDHAFEHGSDAHDIPSLEGMPTGDDLRALTRGPRAGFEAAFVELLRDTLDATRRLTADAVTDAAAVATLAQDATRSCDAALRTL